jgi:hypothetical protein
LIDGPAPGEEVEEPNTLGVNFVLGNSREDPVDQVAEALNMVSGPLERLHEAHYVEMMALRTRDAFNAALGAAVPILDLVSAARREVVCRSLLTGRVSGALDEAFPRVQRLNMSADTSV